MENKIKKRKNVVKEEYLINSNRWGIAAIGALALT